MIISLLAWMKNRRLTFLSFNFSLFFFRWINKIKLYSFNFPFNSWLSSNLILQDFLAFYFLCRLVIFMNRILLLYETLFDCLQNNFIIFENHGEMQSLKILWKYHFALFSQFLRRRSIQEWQCSSFVEFKEKNLIESKRHLPICETIK